MNDRNIIKILLIFWIIIELIVLIMLIAWTVKNPIGGSISAIFIGIIGLLVYIHGKALRQYLKWQKIQTNLIQLQAIAGIILSIFAAVSVSFLLPECSGLQCENKIPNSSTLPFIIFVVCLAFLSYTTFLLSYVRSKEKLN